MYNEELANRILAKLAELFPKSTSSDDLRKFQVGGFEQEPREEWLEAIDALLKLGLAVGKPLHDGNVLVDAANLSITQTGLREIRRIREGQVPSGSPTSESKLVFLSHAAKDQEIAISLKRAIENAVPGSDVFVSSDTEDLHPGDDWVKKILEKLQEARMLLILSTERGLHRPWVWFETGAGWRSGLRMIPCCLGSVRKNELFAPFSSYQALNVDENRDLLDLLREVSRELQLPLQTPETRSIIEEFQNLDQRVHASAESVLTPEEVERRVGMVHVSARISQGHADNFILLLENESEETVYIKEIDLLSEKGVRLTEPHRLDPKGQNKLEAKGRLKVDWRMVTNPADSLLFGTKGSQGQYFLTIIEIIVTCEALKRIKRCTTKLPVQVDVWNHSMSQIGA